MRKARKYSDTGLYHIVIRGVNKQNIFYDDEDRILFLNLLRRYSKKLNVRIYAYCLMDNHVHLEIEDPECNVSIFMQSLCSLYARLFNKKYDRIGHLFQERYASEVINDGSYFLTVFRYILQNPEKAGVCKTSEYEWSSYKAYNLYETFVRRKLLLEYLNCTKNIYDFLEKESDADCLEIELRPSEREKNYIEKIKTVLNSRNPIIMPDLPVEEIKAKVLKLKSAGISIRTISRVTGISKHIVQMA